MVKRSGYIKELMKWRNSQIIKVITGVRRCGKSTLLSAFQQELLNEGVASDQIISINLEMLEYESLKDYHQLHTYVLEHLQKDRMNYVFLDEIQLVPDFQIAVDSLYIRANVDLYITGSNSWLLSGELATLLSGRYIEISMFPYSFREFCEAKGRGADEQLMGEYLQYGAMPYVASMTSASGEADQYLEGIYHTIIMKDIELRETRRAAERGQRKVNDLTLLRNISRYVASIIGSPVSVKNIVNYCFSTGRRVSPNTVDDYLDALVEPYLYYPVERFDMVGQQIMKQNRKYYIVDPGIRNYLVPRESQDLGHSLENMVYLELRRRGQSVYIGKMGNKEIDFICRKGEELCYYQVSASLLDANTFQREITPLQSIPDNHPKTILTMDRLTPGNYGGIRVIHLLDWLMEEKL